MVRRAVLAMRGVGEQAATGDALAFKVAVANQTSATCDGARGKDRGWTRGSKLNFLGFERLRRTTGSLGVNPTRSLGAERGRKHDGDPEIRGCGLSGAARSLLDPPRPVAGRARRTTRSSLPALPLSSGTHPDSRRPAGGGILRRASSQ